ncbi:MAG: SPOR domain-containing protein, partial [Methylococcales bacterium]
IEKRVGIPKYSKPVAKRESRGWSIQVGAFTSYKPAKSAASRARKSASESLRHSRTEISPVRGKKGNIYRARLVGIAKQQAHKACKILLAKHISCMTVPPSKQLAELSSR